MHGGDRLPARALLKRAAAAALALLLAPCAPACGQGAGARTAGDRGMEIRFARSALLAQAATLVIYYYPGASTCPALEATSPRPSPLVGPYQATLDDDQRQHGLTFNQQDVPVGTYVILIDAVDAGGQVVGTGCTPGVSVQDRRPTPVTVTIS